MLLNFKRLEIGNEEDSQRSSSRLSFQAFVASFSSLSSNLNLFEFWLGISSFRSRLYFYWVFFFLNNFSVIVIKIQYAGSIEDFPSEWQCHHGNAIYWWYITLVSWQRWSNGRHFRLFTGKYLHLNFVHIVLAICMKFG